MVGVLKKRKGTVWKGGGGREIAVFVKKLRNLIKKRSFQNGFSNGISISRIQSSILQTLPNNASCS